MVCSMEFNDPLERSSGEEPMNEDAEEARMDEDPDDNQDEQDSGNEDDESDYTGDQEYSLLDKQLDDLNSVLDVLEQKNDRIHAQLKALLENSREIRQDIAVERAKQGAGSSDANEEQE